MFNFAYQLELLLTAAKPPLYLSEKTINRQGPRYICLEGKPGGWLFRFLLSLIGLAPAPRKVEVYSDRIEYSVNAKWFQSKDKITFSTICSTGHQFFRFPHFLILAWICFIYGVLSLIPLFSGESAKSSGSYSRYAPPPSPILADAVQTLDAPEVESAADSSSSYSSRLSKPQRSSSSSGGDVHINAASLVISIICFIAGAIFLWLYFKVQRFIIYVYTNCGKGMLFAFQPRKSFIFAPKDAINISLEDVGSLMNLLGYLIESNKASRITTPVFSNPAQSSSTGGGRQHIAYPVHGGSLSGEQDIVQNNVQVPSSVIQNETEVDEQECEKYINRCLSEYHCSNVNELVRCKRQLSKSVYFQHAIQYASPKRKKQLLEIQGIQEERRMKSRIFAGLAILILILVIVGLVVHARN